MTSSMVPLLLADARLPTGAHAHSAGLEAALLAGMPADAVPGYLQTRLRSSAALDASAAVLAHRIASAAHPVAEDFLKLDGAIAARTPSPAMRQASKQLGRGILRLARSVCSEEAVVVLLGNHLPAPSRPIALGVLAAALGADAAGTALACCYDEAQSVAAAALKLLPLDPILATQWVLGSAELIDDVVDRAVATRSIHDLPAASAPWMEQWSEDHNTRTRRLFIA